MAGSPDSDPRLRWRAPAAAGALVLLVLAAHGPSFAAGLVWDDALFIFENPYIHSPEGLRAIWLTTQLIDYYPVTWTLLWIEWRLFGDDPAGYHAVNVLLHALSVLVAWRVLRRLEIPGSFLAAALFAIHPVGVEVVAWISETKTTLSFLLAGLSLLAYLRFEENGGGGAYRAALLLFALAVLAKTSVVTLPALPLLLAWWRRGAIRWSDLQALAPFFALSLALGLLTVQQQAVHSIGSLEVRPEGLASRLAAAGWCVWFYVFKLLAPFGLSAVYPRWDVDPSWPAAWLPLLGLMALAGLAWARRSSWGGPVLLGFGYYVLILAPVLGLVPFGFHYYSLVADHLQYPAMIGPMALFAAWLRRGWPVRSAPAWLAPLVGVALVATLGALAQQRARVFADHVTLWTDTIEKNPSAWVAHYNLGVALSRSSRAPEAIPHYRRVIELNPEHAQAHDGLGQALRQQGRWDEAVAHYRRALEIDPERADVHNNLANVLRDRGDLDEAIRHYRRALEIFPGFEVARLNLERALEEAERAR